MKIREGDNPTRKGIEDEGSEFRRIIWGRFKEKPIKFKIMDNKLVEVTGSEENDEPEE